jgi:Zn finger protein HypA/HybF involved in hydrogenase expression
MGAGRNAYRAWCSTCRKRRAGRITGGWQRSAAHREFVKDRTECEDCGIEQRFKGMFDVHHKDGDSSNNRLENLALLCPTCHRVADYELSR